MTPEEWQKARLIGENDDDERIDSADDEELDSDAAFDESDEDRYAGFFSSKVGYRYYCYPYSIPYTLSLVGKKAKTKAETYCEIYRCKP